MTTQTNVAKEPVIEVCHGPQCSDFGSRVLSQELEGLGLKTCAGDCRSQCPNAPVVLVNNKMIIHATVQKVKEKIRT